MSHITLITSSGAGSPQRRSTRPANGSAETARAGASDLVVSLAGEIVTQRPVSIDEKASAAAAQFPALHLASQLAISSSGISPADAIRQAKEVISYREAKLYPFGKNNEQLVAEMAEQKGLSDHIGKVAKTLKTQFTDMTDNQAIAEAVAAIMHRGIK